jgi:hypothetical protein
MSSLKKRPFNETLRKCSQSWLKARADVSSSHLNKDSLINSLAAYIDETCPRRADAQAVLPPKISPVLPGSLLAAAGGEPSDTAAVRGDGTKDCGLAGADGVDGGGGRNESNRRGGEG